VNNIFLIPTWKMAGGRATQGTKRDSVRARNSRIRFRNRTFDIWPEAAGEEAQRARQHAGVLLNM